jgi:myosin heavy subunit
MPRAKKKREFEVPIWIDAGSLVWAEIMGEDGEPTEYIKALVKSLDPKTKQCTMLYNSSQGPNPIDADRLQQRTENPPIVSDLVEVSPLNNAELLLCLERRYNNDDIFCDCGPTLLAINPNKLIKKCYTDAIKEEVEDWARGLQDEKPEPHIWTLSAKAYRQMFEGANRKQACCISGESGAGKTYNTKAVMAFITALMRDPKDTSGEPIENRIMACNPILEAFGNATTVRNDDSSRFGKYFEMMVNTDEKVIKGAKIKNYLLEKSRISFQAKNERNYHIFYAFGVFASPEDLKKFMMNNVGDKVVLEKYRFLSLSGRTVNDKVDDNGFYQGIEDAFPRLKFEPEERDMVWSMVSATLQIGNWEIDDKDFQKDPNNPCKIVRNEFYDKACKLLGLDKDKVEADITVLLLTIGEKTTPKVRNPHDVQLIIEALAKDVFDKLFNWMVRKCNTALLPKEDDVIPDGSSNSFGLLDIFGFENFDMNSIEQFCINYTNEKLQYLYITYVFTGEKQIFINEGLADKIGVIKCTDNSPIIMLMDAPKMPPGIFNLLDSNCISGKDDKALLSGIEKSHGKNPHFQTTRIQKEHKEVFKVIHSARMVAYSVWGFTEKNKDELPPDLADTCRDGLPVFSRIFQGKITDDEELEEVKHSSKDKFLGYKFRQQMAELMDELGSCQCNFMRCLKANELKKPNIWITNLALKQLVYLGILDTINLRKMALPVRFEFADFYQHFQDLDGESPNRGEAFPALVEANADFKTMAQATVKTVRPEA